MVANDDLDATISALQSGSAVVSPSVALRAIEGWITTLQRAGMAEIADTLSQLRGELTSDQLTGARIGPILIELATETEAAATGAKAGVAGKLTQLASLLNTVGGAIM